MDLPRICIIGTGSLSTKRIYPYIGAAGGSIAGVCALHEENARRNAQRFGGNAYTDINRMLEKEKPDGVIICIGPEQHSEIAKNGNEAWNTCLYRKASGADSGEALK